VSDPPARPQLAFETHADPALETGSYANALAIWHTPHEFTFDFLVSSAPAQSAKNERGEDVIRAPHRLVARLRVPPTAVFDIIRTINENLTMYEQRFGAIRAPGSQHLLYPPEDPGGEGQGSTDAPG
jgi:hypothetical protein